MRLNRLSPSSDLRPRSTEARLQGEFRSRIYQLLLAGATALSVSACGNGDPNNPDGGAGTGGSAGTGGNTEGGGGTGGGGGNPCEGLVFEGLAAETVKPGESKTVTVSLGESHPDKAYNGLSMKIDGDVITESGLAGLMAKTDVTAGQGYELVEMKGFRTLVIDKENNYRLNESGNCELNTLEVNENVMNDANKQPVVTLPPGMWLSAFRVQNGEGVPEAFEFTAVSTRSRISELNREGYFPANSKPVVISKVTRDPEGHIVVDFSGTTDDKIGNDFVLENLGVAADGGLDFETVTGKPWERRSADPSSVGSFDLFVSGLSEGVTDDTTMVNATVSCEGIDCNGHGTCSEGACACNAGFNNDDSNPTDDCDSCDTESGLYEDDYPVCSEDETPPNDPVITTNGGLPFTVNQDNFILDGTTDIDTHEMWYNIDGGPFSLINSFTSFANSWSENFSNPVVWTQHTYCFRAEDQANNQSGTDCVPVMRTP
ncbi:hypothetical protein KJ657_02525 [Patescibacteria group bacterium]|nr:hypothetical protein [Patescibacteria group bacterium]MBU1015942.1 hypothetical protein [Patescibacteria group bacterium]MBU1938407.1 hypothetical protein [Patescibacteria group bacterium]